MESDASLYQPNSDDEHNIEPPSRQQHDSPPPGTGEHIQTITTRSFPTYTENGMENEPANLERTTSPTTPTATTSTNSSPAKHSSHRDSSWLEVDVCREFLRGNCVRTADECKFAHPTGAVIVKEGNKVTCCFDFLKDRCTRETCKYLHPSNIIKERLVMAGKQYGQVMAMTNKISSPLSPAAMQPLPVNGAYSMPYPAYPDTNSSNTVTNYSSFPYPLYSMRMEVCSDFDHASGFCPNRDNCLYAHPESYVRLNSDNTVTVCWNFVNGSYCRHRNCWYYHPSPIELVLNQIPNKILPQQLPTLENIFISPAYSPDSKMSTSVHAQFSPTLLPHQYPFILPPQPMAMAPSFPLSSASNFSSSPMPQTIVS